MNMKTENWNDHEIRFVEKKPGDWWAVANDIPKALEYKRPYRAVAAHCKGVISYDVPTKGGVQATNIIPELDIYNLIFAAAEQSKNKEIRQKAEGFKHWVFETLKVLRQASGLEGFQIFRMLDKEHQKEAMKRLHDGLNNPVRVNYIKANTIANKAVSTKHNFSKMLKKEEMSPEMLVDRQPILDDTVELMAINERFSLGLSVSDVIYGKHLGLA